MARSLRLGAYLLTALLLAAYALVLWWVAHPEVPENYRAYYIDQTTTCMNQPVPGTYTLGTLVSFLPDGVDAAKPLKPCGWEGPAGDGTHAVGTSARLRFSYSEPVTGPLTLSLDMIAIERNGEPVPQSVSLVVDDRQLATVEVGGTPSHFTLPLPADLVRDGHVEVLLQFPDAAKIGDVDPATRWRSVKLLAAGLIPAA